MKRKRKAFTLIELIIVIAIIAILSAIAIPRYNNAKTKAADTAHEANIKMLKSAAELRLLDGDPPKVEWSKDEEDYKKYIDEWPKIPKGVSSEKKQYEVYFKDGSYTVEPDIDKKNGK